MLLAVDHGQGSGEESPDQEPNASTPDSTLYPPDPNPALHRAQHLARMLVDRWHQAGQRGKGLKVAILDSGFRGYRDHLGKSLPARVTAGSFRTDQNLEARDSQHGILCGEVIHALAPEAELLLVNWEPDRPDKWLEATRWARQQGARIISCSVIMPSWSDGEGHGTVHDGLTKIVGDGSRANDLLCFASAGNTAQRHWAGKVRSNEDGWHEWQAGRTFNSLSPWGSELVSVEMSWQGDADFDLVVMDVTDDVEKGRSSPQRGITRTCAIVRFQPEPRHQYAVRLKQARSEPAAFHLVALGGGLAYATASGSVCFPGDGPEVIAVGAVGPDGERAPYSSCGPNSKQPKPDLVATVPFPSLWRSRPFSGTSAAAPQAAGLAALLWSSHPDWTAREMREALTANAQDLGPVGYDPETGYGVLCLPQIVRD